MADQPNPTAPGHALNLYLQRCQDTLDSFKKGHLTWSEMMDQREQHVAHLNGQLVDHFLVRAHNVRHLANRAASSPRSSGR